MVEATTEEPCEYSCNCQTEAEHNRRSVKLRMQREIDSLSAQLAAERAHHVAEHHHDDVTQEDGQAQLDSLRARVAALTAENAELVGFEALAEKLAAETVHAACTITALTAERDEARVALDDHDRRDADLHAKLSAMEAKDRAVARATIATLATERDSCAARMCELRIERDEARGEIRSTVEEASAFMSEAKDIIAARDEELLKARITLRTRDEAIAQRDDVVEALGMCSPWPVADVLDRLASAGEHLLADHACDAHGWEGVNVAVHEAREAAKRLRAALANLDGTR